jgi:hypothetical protein
MQTAFLNDASARLPAGIWIFDSNTSRDLSFENDDRGATFAQRRVRQTGTVVRTWESLPVAKKADVRVKNSAVLDDRSDDVLYFTDRSRSLNAILFLLRSFSSLQDGWSGDDSNAPKEGVVDDAISFIQLWPEKLMLPEPVLGGDGNIALELYRPDGFCVGGFEFIGTSMVAYSIVDGSSVITKGRMDSTKQTEVLAELKTIESLLE